MRNILRGGIAALAATAVVVATAAAPSAAITGGNPDGEGHPNVGVILFYEDGGRYRCTATLVNPTTLITAAHCVATDGLTIVTFSSVIAEAPPSGLPTAADPAAGYAESDIEGKTGFYIGQAVAHPDYSNFTDLDTWNDVAVVHLTSAVAGITPATIAPENFLEAYRPANILSKTLFELVGYGTEVRKSDVGPQKPTPQSYPLIRRVALSPGQKMTDQIVQMNGNINDTRGTGGTCFGDSGGPSFISGYLVTVTSYGLTQNCRYIGGYQRVDIPGVQQFLQAEGVLAS
ncbi:trypsin-like serine protease [Longivirga aurantiaca]|uniref:Trypsin-like serine protease n=1 Tax=Longivirga aurantiaca TaxID=1837743 RepID=A0ABW1T1G7_9ACTN